MRSIKDAIKQESFQSPQQKAFLNILYTSNYLRDLTAPYFKEAGILQQHYNVLRIVKGKGGEASSPGQIIEVMLDKGRDLTRLVDKLVKLEYLERRASQVNRRKVDIYITKEGIDITEKIDEKIVKVYAELGITDEEAETLSTLLDKLRV